MRELSRDTITEGGNGEQVSDTAQAWAELMVRTLGEMGVSSSDILDAFVDGLARSLIIFSPSIKGAEENLDSFAGAIREAISINWPNREAIQADHGFVSERLSS